MRSPHIIGVSVAVGLLGAWLGPWMLVRQAPLPQAKAMVTQADRAMPATIVIAKDTPDDAYLCAELPAGKAACRPVGEVRGWLRQAATKKAK